MAALANRVSDKRKINGFFTGGLVSSFLILALAIDTCQALSFGPPASYESIAGANDEYRLVMLVSSDPLYTDDGKPYPVSGLYKNDGSVEPLWQVEWVGSLVRITQDGRYLAQIGSSAYSLDEMAVTFFDRGKSIKTLRVTDFIKPSEEPKAGMAGYAWNLEIAFDDKRGLLRITTLKGEVLYYSMATGQVVEPAGL